VGREELMTRCRLFRMLAEDVEQGHITSYEFHLAVAQVNAAADEWATLTDAAAPIDALGDELSPTDLIATLRLLADDMERCAGLV
jgi:hypothetical protein